jgi:D-sedoheptulose 7-phosphate isomerase
MKNTVKNIFEDLFIRYPGLEPCRCDIEEAFAILKDCYGNGGKVLVCGNGGSAADAEHIVGELMKGFMLKRSLTSVHQQKLKKAFIDEGQYLVNNLQGTLPAISLVSQTSLAYAYINDVEPDMVFAQQVYGYGKAGDVLIGISTSGNSKNVINAIKVAKTFSLRTIGMTGAKGGVINVLCDVTMKVPAEETFKIQEYHLPVYHALCAMIEMEFFGGV